MSALRRTYCDVSRSAELVDAPPHRGTREIDLLLEGCSRALRRAPLNFLASQKSRDGRAAPRSCTLIRLSKRETPAAAEDAFFESISRRFAAPRSARLPIFAAARNARFFASDERGTNGARPGGVKFPDPRGKNRKIPATVGRGERRLK